MKVRLRLSNPLNSKKILVAILGIILVLLGVGSWYLLDSGGRSVLSYKSPYTFQTQPGFASQPLAERLILVIVDGLESGSAENMLAARDLANRGAAVCLQGSRGLAPIPASTVLMTGAFPEISGVATNWFNTGVMVDSLWSSARRTGLNTMIVGDDKWRALFGDVVTKGIYHKADGKLSNTEINDAILKDAIIEIKQGESRLMLVNFLPERSIAHSLRRTTRQDITREEAEANIDMRLSDLLDATDLGSSAIIVVLDRSHLTQNRLVEFPANTGDAFLIAAGAGIVTPAETSEAIQWGSGRPVDIAPTCASLIGIPIPFHSQGKVIFSMLDMPQHIRSEIAIRQTAQRRNFAIEYMSVLGRQANEDRSQMNAFLLHNDGRYQDAYEEAESIDERIISSLKKTRAGLVASSRLVSIPVLTVVAAVLICIIAMLTQGNLRKVLVSVIGVFCYFTAYYGLLLIRGTPLSSDAILHPSELTGFYHGRIIDTAVSLAFTAIVIGWIASGKKEDLRSRQGFISGLVSFGFIALALIAPIGAFVVAEGFNYNLYLPDMQKGFRCFMYLIQLMTAGILSPVLAGLSEGVVVMASKARPSSLEQHESLSE